MDKLMDMYLLMDKYMLKYMLKYMYSLICLGLLGFACLCLNVASKSSICLICLTLLDLADGWRRQALWQQLLPQEQVQEQVQVQGQEQVQVQPLLPKTGRQIRHLPLLPHLAQTEVSLPEGAELARRALGFPPPCAVPRALMPLGKGAVCCPGDSCCRFRPVKQQNPA